MIRKHWLAAALVLLGSAGLAQKRQAAPPPPAAPQEIAFFKNLEYRLIGPFRGGRSAAVAGSFKNKNTFYFGATGGGVWKTTDGGNNWTNISDGFLAVAWASGPMWSIQMHHGSAWSTEAFMPVRCHMYGSKTAGNT
jgi:hypothetical protein